MSVQLLFWDLSTVPRHLEKAAGQWVFNIKTFARKIIKY